MDALFFISVGVASAIMAEPFVRKRAAKKRRNKICEKERKEYRQRTEYNRSHMPSKELPPLAPDWSVINRFFESITFRLYDKGDVFDFFDYDKGSHKVPKTDFDSDTLELIEIICDDVRWFNTYPTGVSWSACRDELESFLREKYPRLSEKAADRICYFMR